MYKFPDLDVVSFFVINETFSGVRENQLGKALDSSTLTKTVTSDPFLEGTKEICPPTDFYFLLPDFFTVISAIILCMYGVIYSTARSYRYPTGLYTSIPIAVFILFCTTILLYNSPLQNGIIFNHSLIFDNLSSFVRYLSCVGGSAAILLGYQYFQKESQNNFEYIILILLALFSMFILASSFDFLSMYLAIELSSLCFYVCAASKRYSEFSTEAGLKYFILGAFSSGLLLFGISFIYGFSGIMVFSDCSNIAATFSETNTNFYQILSPGMSTGYIFLAIGLLFKLAAAPFHMWAPDVYEGAPTPFTAFFAINGKTAILAVFLRIFSATGDSSRQTDYFTTGDGGLQTVGQDPLSIIFFCSIASMLYGSFAAISQKKIKRVLAYSSIAHVGFILIGLHCNGLAGYQSIFIYLFIYIVMNCGIFAIVLLDIHRTDGDIATVQIKYLSDFAFSSQTNKLLALSFALFMFSLAALPPTIGFYSKAFLFYSAMGSGRFLLAIIAIFTSVCSCFYYIRFCRIIYFSSSAKTGWTSLPLHFNRMDKGNAYIAAICFFLTAFGICWTAPLYSFTNIIAIETGGCFFQ